MELNKIQNKFIINGGRIYANKYESKIEIGFISNKSVFIYLDIRIFKDNLILIDLCKEYSMYLISSKFRNPRYLKYGDDFNIENLENFFNCLSLPEFYFGFKKIQFDPIENMNQYSIQFECSDSMIKNSLINTNQHLSQYYYEWNNNGEKKYTTSEEIREYFGSLWRDIQISKLTS